MIVLDKAQIAARLDLARAAEAVEEAYRAASAGEVELPPVGHITFPGADADCHIKFGHRRGDEVFVIKVATGFPDNDPADAPVNNGVSLVLSAETGEVMAILHDEMMLTDIRTGIGGAIASRTLARSDARRMLVVGTGIQCARQIESHRALLSDDLDITIWGRNADKAAAAAVAAGECAVADDLAGACLTADIIVTTTAARSPLIDESMVRPGTHITALGADAPGKRELSAALLERADVVVADSAGQCLDHGELAALADPRAEFMVPELGAVLAGSTLGRTDDAQITIADLTGIAAQDIAIASTVLG